jgi:WD40 repeat protein
MGFNYLPSSDDIAWYFQADKGHAHIITSLCWSRCGRFILSTSLDWNAILWDLKTVSRLETFRFDAPVLAGSMRRDTILIHIHNDLPFIMTKKDQYKKKYPLEIPEKMLNFTHAGRILIRLASHSRTMDISSLLEQTKDLS